MYPDEIRDRELHERQLLEDVVSEPEALRTAYLEIVTREQQTRDRIAHLEREMHDLQVTVRREKKASAQVPALMRRLGSANAALDAYRVENRRLKEDLSRLRRSRAIRFSKAVTGPIRGAKRAVSAGIVNGRPAGGDGREGAAASLEAAASPTASSGEPPQGLWDKRPSECTLDELRQRLEERPTSEALGYVLNRAWFAHGLISEPAQFLERWPDLAADLEGPVRRLADRIRGGHRMMVAAADLIPARARGVAYLPERDRVMYCVHSTPAYNSNGYSTRTRGVAAGLTSNGIDVRVVARAGYPWDSKTDVPTPARRRSVTSLDGVDYVHLTGPNVNHDPHDHVIQQMADAFVREARLYRPSLIQAASNHRIGLAALIAARRLGVPFVYEVRGLWELTEASSNEAWLESDRFAIAKRLETLVASEADHVLAITQEVADELVARGVPADSISLLPNGVDPDQFTPLYADQQMRKRITPDAGSAQLPTIGFAGSMVDYEGLDLLLEASTVLHARGVPHQVALAGSGPVEPALRAMAKDRGLDHVHFLGRLPAKDIPRLLSVLDVVACPRRSTLITELVSPLKPLEAMSAGRAVVLSDVAPNATIAGLDGTRAVLHPADDARALADALEPLLLDADARRRLGRHARRWILAERSWHRLGQAMTEAHGTAAARHTSKARDTKSLPLRDLRVAVVADEFTTTTLAAEVAVTTLGRHTWAEQIEEAAPHLVFVESAWANNGEWSRGVGYYSDHEHADFRALVDFCRARGIPTVFWNKEDPVHFNRFVKAAAECDHIFTTDADMIPDYLAAATRARTASALPFYAAPTIHNPLPGSLPAVRGASYAGTFYGERYAKRSQELTRLLSEAAPFGLTIYDRQADNPDSPYRFPPHLQRFVVGSLPYAQVLDAYKAHTANLNVNSVSDSPSMFSRRVVEVAASGALTLSAPGRGITETFGDAIACSGDAEEWRAWLRAWTTSPQARVSEAWLQMRSVLRSHTSSTALTLVARTAGIPVEAPSLPAYDAVLYDDSPAYLRAVAQQSVLPRTVYLGEVDASVAAETLPPSIRVLPGLPAPERPHIHFHSVPDRTVAEDLLQATRWGTWGWVSTRVDGAFDPPYARPTSGQSPRAGVVLELSERGSDRGLVLTRPPAPRSPGADRSERASLAPVLPSGHGTRLLVAGHDLKFADGLIKAAQAAGMEVSIDQWKGHAQHDVETSRQLLSRADVVFCEWGLGNAVWYSKHVADHQRLLVRVHQQELRLDYLRRINHDAVDQYIFVGRTVLESAVASHAVPRARSSIIHNYVDTDGLDLPKNSPDVRFALGLIGPLPAHKRLDLALDLVEALQAHDPRYHLRVKGKRPDELPWLRDLPEESAFFTQQLARIDAMNAATPGSVRWSPHGPDVPQWLTDVGVVLSVSDMESFHYSVADGAASGSVPVVLRWAGADYLYPEEWLCSDLGEMVTRIRDAEPGDARSFVVEHYSADTIIPQLLATVSTHATSTLHSSGDSS